MGLDEQSALLQQIARNAFRALGLPADAPQKVILERANALQRAAKAGITRKPSEWNLEEFGPLKQDRASISDAVGRLSNPKQRLTERLFWFVRYERYYADYPADMTAADRHDEAVFALASCFLTDSDVQDADGWASTLQMWADLLESEEFWGSFFDIESAGDFEPSASFEDLDELRARSHQLAIGPVAELAREAASRSQFDSCRRALETIRSAPFPLEIVSAAEESVLGPYEDALVRTSKEITKACWDEIRQDRASAQWNANVSSVAVNQWKQDVEPRYRNLITMTGAGTDCGMRIRQEYADFLTGLGNALTWADQWVEAEKVLKLGLSCLPSNSPARERIEESLLGVEREATNQTKQELERRQQADIEGFERLCEEIPRGLWKVHGPAGVCMAPVGIDACKQAERQYKKTVSPWLSIILAADLETNHGLKARTAAARCLLGIAERFRSCGECSKALDLLARAAELAPAGSATAAEIARQRAHLYRESSSRPTPEAAVEADRTGSVDGFVELCDSIMQNYRQQFRQGPVSDNFPGNLLALKKAHNDYKRRASPWLTVIFEGCHGELPARVGNAAARCLSCLAEGYIWVRDLDAAKTLAQQAIPLIADTELEAEVEAQLASIAAQRQKFEPKLTGTDHAQTGAGRSGAPGRRTASLWLPEIIFFVFIGAVVIAAILGFTKSNESQSPPLVTAQEESPGRPTPAPTDFARLTLDAQLEALQRASPKEKQQLKPIFRERFKRDIAKVPDEEQELLFRKIAAAGLLDDKAFANSLGVYDPSELSDKPPASAPAARAPLTFDASEVDADQTRRAANAPKRPAAIDSDASAKQFGGTSEPATQWTIVPARPLLASVSLPNGTELIPPPPSEASSELRVSNHTKQDAVVKLKAAINKETLRSVYVRAMSDFTIPKIAAGSYLIEFATGKDWDESSRSFAQDRGFARFGNPMVFSEDQAGYSTNSITLHTVVNGNARKETISAEEFGDDAGAGPVRRPGR